MGRDKVILRALGCQSLNPLVEDLCYVGGSFNKFQTDESRYKSLLKVGMSDLFTAQPGVKLSFGSKEKQTLACSRYVTVTHLVL